MPPPTALASAAAPQPAAGAAAKLLATLKGQQWRDGQASFFFMDTHFAKPSVKVLPGEYFVHDADLVITTTLGSCIAACIWDRDRKIGGMNHYMLPDNGGANGRYGLYAMDLLIGQLVKRGANRSSMEAKIFGGGAVISGMNTIQVGERNTAFVIEYLKTERIPIVAKDVMDIYPRKVCFLPATGKAMVKRLAPATASNVLAEEQAARKTAAKQPASTSGSIDLF